MTFRPLNREVGLHASPHVQRLRRLLICLRLPLPKGSQGLVFSPPQLYILIGSFFSPRLQGLSIIHQLVEGFNCSPPSLGSFHGDILDRTSAPVDVSCLGQSAAPSRVPVRGSFPYAAHYPRPGWWSKYVQHWGALNPPSAPRATGRDPTALCRA